MKDESRDHAKIVLDLEKAAGDFFSLVESQA